MVHFGCSLIIDVAVNLDWAGRLVAIQSFEEVLGFVHVMLGLFGAIVRNNHKERFVHNVCFLRKLIDKVDVVIHEACKQHVVLVAAQTLELFDIWTNIDALRADQNLDGEIDGVQEILIRHFDAFSFSFGHEVEVDRLTGNNGAEGAIFHDDHGVAELREK